MWYDRSKPVARQPWCTQKLSSHDYDAEGICEWRVHDGARFDGDCGEPVQ